MAAPYTDDAWIEGEGEGDDAGLKVRCRAKLPAPAARKGWDHLVLIGWTYEEDAVGQALKDIVKDIATFEAAMAKALAAPDTGVLAAVIAGAGMREWRYYTPSTDSFMDALNEALEELPDYPLEFMDYEDPDWNALAELIED
ncbi:MAG: DUF695 domain-containing protein [Pseudomonadota bacterium]